MDVHYTCFRVDLVDVGNGKDMKGLQNVFGRCSPGIVAFVV